MKKILLILSAVIFCGALSAQTRLIGERSVYTQYFMTPFLMNPGATGQKDYSQVIANYRSAWTAFPGAPKTVTLAYEGNLGNRIGLGLIGVSDRFSALSTNKLGLNLSYTITTADHKIGVGLAGEYIQHSLNGDEFVGNNYIDLDDPSIRARLDGIGYFDATIGVYGTYMDKIVYGVSFPSLVSQKVSGTQSVDPSSDFNFIANVGYRFRLEDKDVTLEPSIYVKQLILVPFHVDLNLKADFLNESLTAGVTYSYGAEDRLGFLLGTELSNFVLSYTYNVSLHEFQQYNNGSHELGLRLKLIPYAKK